MDWGKVFQLINNSLCTFAVSFSLCVWLIVNPETMQFLLVFIVLTWFFSLYQAKGISWNVPLILNWDKYVPVSYLFYSHIFLYIIHSSLIYYIPPSPSPGFPHLSSPPVPSPFCFPSEKSRPPKAINQTWLNMLQ